MKRTQLIAAACVWTVMAAMAPAQEGTKKATTPSGDLTKQASYCIGVSIGRDFKNQDLDLDPEQLVLGLRDALTGTKAKLSDEDMDRVLNEFRAQLATRAAEKAKLAIAKNKKECMDFLASNGKKPGVKATRSGLQYQVIAEGKGDIPTSTDTVRVHYQGTLIDGTEFDSSYKRGEPATFPLDGVIKGWTEGLQLMKVGGKSRFFIPAELAYGDTPPPGSPIGPGAMLIFDVELLEIVK